MEQKRKFQRFPVHLHARYNGPGNIEGSDCTITEISRSGVIMKLRAAGKIKAGLNLILEVDMPSCLQPASMLVHIKWTKQDDTGDGKHTVAGAKITIIKQSDRAALLSHAYEHIINQEKDA